MGVRHSNYMVNSAHLFFFLKSWQGFLKSFVFTKGNE